MDGFLITKRGLVFVVGLSFPLRIPHVFTACELYRKSSQEYGPKNSRHVQQNFLIQIEGLPYEWAMELYHRRARRGHQAFRRALPGPKLFPASAPPEDAR